ncbi:MAG: alpha/beta hydrolase [Fusicatenibacter sp.]|nr:alpha/beta hydrolase [Fusicatenibacter sp.]
MLYQVLDVKVKGTEETAKLYTYFLDNSEEMDPNRTRPVVVICPGGAYGMTSDREAEAIAMKFLGAGFHAAILRYSVMPERYPVALRQLAYAVAHIRQHAGEYHVDPEKIIIQGSSAGGHLAASYGVFWKKKTFLAKELSIDPEILRPNGLLLSYPVITSGQKAHRGSFENLLGERYEELADEMSLENQVSGDTPQTFLWHTAPDDVVPVENSILFFQALHALSVPAELHIYPVGGHGLGLADEETRGRDGYGVQEECRSWISLAIDWIRHLQ